MLACITNACDGQGWVRPTTSQGAHEQASRTNRAGSQTKVSPEAYRCPDRMLALGKMSTPSHHTEMFTLCFNIRHWTDNTHISLYFSNKTGRARKRSG